MTRAMRVEGAALAAAALAVYWGLDGSWWLWLALILAPDVCFAAFLANRQAGVVVYNAAHMTVAPLLVAAGAVVAGERLPLLLAAIWLAHIGIDRALGFGLKSRG